jgi:hypothetical protein
VLLIGPPGLGFAFAARDTPTSEFYIFRFEWSDALGALFSALEIFKARPPMRPRSRAQAYERWFALLLGTEVRLKIESGMQARPLVHIGKDRAD